MCRVILIDHLTKKNEILVYYQDVVLQSEIVLFERTLEIPAFWSSPEFAKSLNLLKVFFSNFYLEVSSCINLFFPRSQLYPVFCEALCVTRVTFW